MLGILSDEFEKDTEDDGASGIPSHLISFLSDYNEKAEIMITAQI